LFFLHKSGKAIERVGPEALVAVQPVHRLLHRLGRQATRHGAADLFARNQARIRQHIEMLHDRRQRHRKRLRQLTDREAFPAAEPRQERPPRRIRERRKGAVQGLATILHHMV